MEPLKGGGGGGRVGVGEDHDMADGMQCTDHPFRNNPGGICAFCLQEKLGKLVSSSFPLPIHAPSSSSSSPSFRSDLAPSSSTTRPSLPPTATSAPAPSSSSSSLPRNHSHYHHYYARRSRLPFLLSKKKKKKPSPNASSDIVLKRSKSTATPRRNHSLVDADDDDDAVIEDFSPRKRYGFWSFLYLSSKSSKKLNSKSFRDGNAGNTPRISTINSAAGTSSVKLKEKPCSASSLKTDIVVEQHSNNNTNSPNSHTTASASSLERKVSRSRSVGCGSRSFSGDFFERISTGFGDCTLRRVESQREGKPKAAGGGASAVSRGGDHHHHHCMKERVRCGGLFSGFMLTSSSSSSSSSSYWVSSSADDGANGKSASVALSHNRGRSWGWAFASPMRAFSGKPSSKESNRRDIIRDANDNKNSTPNLSAIPSLLAVRS
ncbi:unnamed protein product [Sphenostylis stenocarpa]|uniref:Uncharacterized protein n=1 Tax=Sphenostylis stenocarpa TaxID=92480 RepID=A0AA86S412_9FABA|nr:unnamed protein product [Sphenostylis stenocarpa]